MHPAPADVPLPRLCVATCSDVNLEADADNAGIDARAEKAAAEKTKADQAAADKEMQGRPQDAADDLQRTAEKRANELNAAKESGFARRELGKKRQAERATKNQEGNIKCAARCTWRSTTPYQYQWGSKKQSSVRSSS